MQPSRTASRWLWTAILASAWSLAPAARAEDARALARTILDDSAPAEARETAIRENPELAADLVAAMAEGLDPSDEAEQYRRIPWIWRVSIASAKRLDDQQIARLLDVSLPKADAPLEDWQAVVIGGGVINGISLAGPWPDERIGKILEGRDDLKARWERSLELAAAMADDEKVRTGTRYDALRMIGVEPWERRGDQLARYLAEGVNAELQQGAISGLADLRSPETAGALLSGFAHYSPSNRNFALDALLRTPDRAGALLDAVADGRVKAADLGPERIETLKRHEDKAVRERAAELLGG